jgi:BirA family biotin operon repressor/biotin-[acetyl-CoA-carboxylase] ligase
MKNNPDIIWLDKAESSNETARSTIETLDNLSVVAVRWQTSGRGQGTHTWESAQGENLTFSVVLKDLDILPKELVAISQITALSIVDFLSLYGIDAKIKLPNDIYVGARKISGILIENSICAGKLRWSIIGIGINVNQTVFSTSLPNPTSMSLERNHPTHNLHNHDLDLNMLLLQFREIFTEYYSQYIFCRDEGRLQILEQLFRSKLLIPR